MRQFLILAIMACVVGCELPPPKQQQKKTTPQQTEAREKPSKEQPSKPQKREPSSKESVKPSGEGGDNLIERFRAAYAAARKAHEAYYRARLLQRRFDQKLLNEALTKVEEAFKLASAVVRERPEDAFVREAHTWLGQARFALKEEKQQHQRLKRTKTETSELLKKGKKSKAEGKVEEKPKPVPKGK